MHRVLALALLLSMAPLASAQTGWLRDIGILGSDTKPRFEQIEFWDPQTREMRPIRALFYTVLPEKKNRVLDRRLHTQMTQYLNTICGAVITLETFDNPEQQRMVENEIVELLDEWELQGRVNPGPFFEDLPFLDVDVVIFMERSLYDPAWQGEKKFLDIGVDLAAVEMDMGEPVFSERFTRRVPWSGESTSYIKAEQRALLDAANSLGKQFSEIARMINQLREKERQEEIVSEEMQRREERTRQQNEFRAYQALAAEGVRMLNERSQPAGLIDRLTARLEAFVPLVQQRELDDARTGMRRRLAQDVAFTMQAILDWVPPQPTQPAQGPEAPMQSLSDALTEEATSSARSNSDLSPVDLLAPDAAPGPTPLRLLEEPMVDVPGMPGLLQSIFDRSWLKPSSSGASSTPAPASQADPTPTPSA